MPLMLDDMRSEFARFLTEDPAARFRMDAALAHVITIAYEHGLDDGKTSERERADYAWRNANTIEKARQEEMVKRDYLATALRDVFPAAHRLALELECLLLDTEDNAVVSKWWNSAHEALEQWREFLREDASKATVPPAPTSGT